MTKGELLKFIDECAIDYVTLCRESLKRSRHMHEAREDQIYELPQTIINAIVVDFVNYIGAQQGLDYGMYTKDLKKKETTDIKPALERIPGYGKRFPIDTFAEMIACGGIDDDDGCGQWATNEHLLGPIDISDNIFEEKPVSATQVVWFNK